MPRRALAGILGVLLVFGTQAFAAKVQCPRYSVLLEGTNVFRDINITFRVAAHKIGAGDGYQGMWKVDTIEIVEKYPYTFQTSIDRTDRVELYPGEFMIVRSSISGNTIYRFSEIVSAPNLEGDGNKDRSPYMEVVDNKVRLEDTTSWIGAIDGSRMSWNWFPGNPNTYLTTITGVIQEGPKEPIELTFIEPAAEAKYVYDSSSPGKLVLRLKAKVTPSSHENDIQWEVPEIEESKRKVSPESAKGASVEVTYEGLPESYKSFGKKAVKATLKVGSCIVSEDRDIRVFYQRDAKNNPAGKDWNWFYYWTQTPAARPHGQRVNIEFGGFKQHDLCGDMDAAAIFVPDFLYKTIHVCDLTVYLDRNFTLVFPKVKRDVTETLLTRSYGRTTHIDTFAVMILHEYKHFLAFHNWSEGKTDAKIKAEDRDEDGIPDDLESEMGFSPTTFQTFWGEDPYWKEHIGGDEEFLAYEEMYDYEKGSYDDCDWGKPGKNWE